MPSPKLTFLRPRNVGKASSKPNAVMNSIASSSAKIASNIVDVAGFLDDVGDVAMTQRGQMTDLQVKGQQINEMNASMRHGIEEVSKLSADNLSALMVSRDSFKTSAQNSTQVANWVRDLETRLDQVSQALTAVQSLNEEITGIARQVNLLAINAKIEAVRAGQSGRGFAVVAEAINDLSRKTSKAAESVSEQINTLGTEFVELGKQAGSMQGKAASLIEEVAATDTKLNDMSAQMEQTVGIANRMRDDAAQVSTMLDTFTPAFNSMAKAAIETADGVENTRHRLHGLIDESEAIVGKSILAGGASEDMEFIRFVCRQADKISNRLEKAVAKGEISLNDLFDRDYRPIPGSNPEQFSTRYNKLFDAIIPEFAEPAFKIGDRIVGCCTSDVNGYIGTHNNKYSHPQSDDPDWNRANCRNRTKFEDRVALKASRSTAPFILQVYRRDMGGGTYTLIKDASAPIMVNGRHWGCLRLLYKL